MGSFFSKLLGKEKKKETGKKEFDEEDEEKVKERLKGLGYLD